MNAVVALTDKGQELQKLIEDIQVDMAQEKEKLMELIQPLNVLGEREVKTPEVQKILEQLQEVELALQDAEVDLENTKTQTKDLQHEIDNLLDGEKNRKIQQADEALGLLDKELADLDDLRRDCRKKLEKYQDMIADAKAKEGQGDPQLMSLLKKLEKEAAQISDTLKDIEIKSDDLKKKREDAKAMIDDAFANPENFNPQQIDGIIDNIDELIQKAKGHVEKLENMDQDLDRRIDELADLLNQSNTQKALDKGIQAGLGSIKDDLATLKDLLGKLPLTADKLGDTLAEMKKGSVPDKTADYWEERADIEKWIEALIGQQDNIKKIRALFDGKDKKFRDLSA